MYGMVNRAIEDLVTTNFGEDKWEEIKEKAGIEEDIFLSNESYPDEMTYRLVSVASETLGAAPDRILHDFGEWWILKTATKGYGALMDAGGSDFVEFMENLPNFHTRVAMIFPNLEPPRFEIVEKTEEFIRFGYYSHREGLAPFVIGLINGLGKRFNQSLEVAHVVQRSEGADHDEFTVRLS